MRGSKAALAAKKESEAQTKELELEEKWIVCRPLSVKEYFVKATRRALH